MRSALADDVVTCQGSVEGDPTPESSEYWPTKPRKGVVSFVRDDIK